MSSCLSSFPTRLGSIHAFCGKVEGKGFRMDLGNDGMSGAWVLRRFRAVSSIVAGDADDESTSPRFDLYALRRVLLRLLLFADRRDACGVFITADGSV